MVLGTKKSDTEMQIMGDKVRKNPLNDLEDRKKGALMVCASGHQTPNQTRTGAKRKSCLVTA